MRTLRHCEQSEAIQGIEMFEKREAHRHSCIHSRWEVAFLDLFFFLDCFALLAKTEH